MKDKIVTSKGILTLFIPDSPILTPAGEWYTVCPICTPSRQQNHKKEKKLAVHLKQDNKYGSWRCNHCGEKGYLTDENGLSKQKVKPLLKRTNKKSISTSDAFVKWIWDNRKISVQTLNYFKIEMTMETFLSIRGPEKFKGKYVKRKAINFKYFKDNILINVKYRDEYKNFKMETGASKILYNLDAIKKSDWCIITEGEFDSLAYHEAGIYPVTSVPNGVTITDEEKEHYEKTGKLEIISHINMEYLDNCIEDFENKNIIYLATDDDPAGVKLREELARRLGKDRCRYIKFSRWKKSDGEPCNDPDDVLIHHGKEVLKDTLEYAEGYPVDGVITARDCLEDIEYEYDHGIKMGIPCGYKKLDPHFRWVKGWLYIGNGFPREGKSTLWLNFAAISAWKYGWKWGGYMPENYPVRFIYEVLVEIITGKSISEEYGNRISKERLKKTVNEFINEHFYFYDSPKSMTPEDILDKEQKLIHRYGIDGVIVDPWKNLRHNRGSMTLDEYIQNKLNDQVKFTISNNIVKIISHHPPTPDEYKNTELQCPSPFKLIGGQVWFSTTYSMIAAHRRRGGGLSNTLTEIHVQKNKYEKIAGIPTEKHSPILLKFERNTNRFLEPNGDLNDPKTRWTFPIDEIKERQTEIYF